MRASASWRLLLRSLRPRPSRAVVSAAGVGAAALLVLVLLAARRSLETAVRGVAGSPDVDVWVAPLGTDNLVRASGGVPEEASSVAAGLPGVERADPLLRLFVPVEAGPGEPPRRLTLLALGVRTPGGLGGPRRLVSGRTPSGPDEVTLDRAAAFQLGVGVGEEIRVASRGARVVGLTAGTNLLATQLLFFDLAAEEGILPPSFVAVRLSPGASARDVATRLERALPRTRAFSCEEFLRASLREAASGFRPLLLLVSALGLAVAGVLVALLLQGVVEDRRSDVAVLLAMGAPPASLAGAVVAHAALLALVGSAAGSVAAPLLAAVLDRMVPTVELAPSGADALGVLALFASAGAVGGLGPLARLVRVEPMEAFRP